MSEKVRLSEELRAATLLIQELNGEMEASDRVLCRARGLEEIGAIALRTAQKIDACARSLEGKAAVPSATLRSLAERSGAYRALSKACREFGRV